MTIRPDDHRVADVVVVGSGIAGLSTALHAKGARVALLTDDTIGSGSASDHAQGGIAAAVADSDSPVAHAADTLVAGAHANDPGIVDLLTTSAPAAIGWLDGLGAQFERDGNGTLLLGREGGHRQSRIVHARGDATGREVVAVLAAAVAAASHVTTHAATRVVDLLVDGQCVVGVLARDREGRLVAYRAGAVVLATGGSAGAWRPTTNPASSRGSGLVLAADAGAHLIDLEYVQFHPTALACDADPLPLLTEALRGAGATVVDTRGRRFLDEVHDDAELAPRDVVARALWQRGAAGGSVLLDMRHIVDLDRRFPTAVALCRRHGLDPFTEPVPITPAAHYHMGGVAVDDTGRTGVNGLFACGEVSCTGAHGANRLASNSLLEALVFGERVGRAVRSVTPAAAAGVDRALARIRAERLTAPSDDAVTAVRDLLMSHVGVLRTEAGLQSALQQLETLAAPGRGGPVAALARMVTTAALHHRGARGAHWRADAVGEGERQRAGGRGSLGEGERQRAGGRGSAGATDAHRVVVTAADRSRPIATVVAPAWRQPQAAVAC